MIKRSVILACLILMVGGQVAMGGEMPMVGVKAGISIATLRGDDVFGGADSHTGISIGGSLEYKVTPMVLLISE